jgi:hypothetical protein
MRASRLTQALKLTCLSSDNYEICASVMQHPAACAIAIAWLTIGPITPSLADGFSVYTETDRSSRLSAVKGGPSTALASLQRNGQPGAARSQKKGEGLRNLRPELPPSTGPWRWKISKTEWSAEDELGFESFVRAIGESDCATVHQCLTSATANPLYHDKHPSAHQFFADCADLPIVLRAYFAWHNGLPFSFSLRLEPHAPTSGHRTYLTGNAIAARHDVVGPGPDLRPVLKAVNDYVTAEHYRWPSAYSGKQLADHYPVAVTRQSIRTGTVVFDPDGHVAIVYKVTEDGRIHYIDAHPDNSLTRGLFDREFGRTVPPMGAGFKRWRPQRLVGAHRADDGTLSGGSIVLAKDSELSDWSDEQFFGTEQPRPPVWTEARFMLDGQNHNFHDYVRLKLAFPGFKYDPIDEARTRVRQLCRDFSYRDASVKAAISDGINRRPQPPRLPNNIYATSGDWETYSTPSRDARIKAGFEQLREEIERFVEHHDAGRDVLAYTGTDLRRDLLATYREEAAACAITYVNSVGKPVTLGFNELKRRLFRMSFDPHHCIERRWGADSPDELRSCEDDALKTSWYVAQARLRHQTTRTYGERMGWTLADLKRKDLDIGVEEPPDVDPLEVLLARTAHNE